MPKPGGGCSRTLDADLPASRFNNKLNREFISRSKDPVEEAVVALESAQSDPSFFFPKRLPCLLLRVKMETITVILIAMGWPMCLW